MNFKTKTLYQWRSPASKYPRRRSGSASIRTSWYEPGIYAAYRTRNLDYYMAARRLYITTLKIDGKVWMVDDPPHWWAMQEHAEAYEGHVVCAGLGLGLIVHALNENLKVNRITVVERSQDVIDLISPLIPHDKLTIIHEDWFAIDADFLPKADGVFFDLFVGNGMDLFGEAVHVSVDILQRWKSHLPVRVHGLPNPLVSEIAQAIVEQDRLDIAFQSRWMDRIEQDKGE
jgi:hypothetical protein